MEILVLPFSELSAMSSVNTIDSILVYLQMNEIPISQAIKHQFLLIIIDSYQFLLCVCDQ